MNMRDYPLPAFAANIWTSGNRLILGLPPSADEGRGHMVEISLDNPSWATALLRVLRDRELHREAPHKIAEPGVITQAQLNEMLKGLKATRIETRKRLAPAELSLEDLDL